MKYCKKCKVLLTEWETTESVAQKSTYTYELYDIQGMKGVDVVDVEVVETFDVDRFDDYCPECNSILEEKEMREDTMFKIVSFMYKKGLTRINPKDSRILKYYL